MTRQFTATGLYTDSTTQDLTTQVTWASSDGAVANVSNTAGSNGLATTVSVGSTTVSAIFGGLSGGTTLTVTGATLVSIEVSPATPSIANGLTQQFTATGLFTDSTTQDLTTQVTWGSAEGAVATVSNAAGSNGLATTTAVGNTSVSATSVGVSGSTVFTVTDATLVSIEVSPATPSLANGLTQQFTATGLFTDNTTQDLTTQVTWESSDSAVATVSNAAGSNGLSTTASAGNTTVSATKDGISGDTVFTVTDATLVSVDVLPAAPSVANGLTQQFTATGHFTDGSTEDLTTQVTWGSSDGAVATVSNVASSNGLAMTASVGTTTVSATIDGVSGDTVFTVTDATLVSIEVLPAMPSVANGLTQQFTATGRFTDNSTQDLTTQVTWDSSDGAVATVSNTAGANGLAMTSSAGDTTVSATSDGVSGSTVFTVTDATLVSIEVSPAMPSVANGLTQQFTATGHYTDSTTQDLTSEVIWASSDGAIASVSNAAGTYGLATTASVGSTTVSAISGSVVGDTIFTVTDATLASIEVLPATPSVANGQAQQFTATGHYTDNTTLDLTTDVTWGSSDGSVATVSNDPGSNGLATTTSAGTTTVSATSGSVSGEATLTVTDATLVSIDVTPTTATVANGQTQQFTATGHYTDNTTLDLTTEVTWDSSDSLVATLSNDPGSNGLATTTGVGNTTVSATSGAVSGSASLTVASTAPTVDDLLAALHAAVIGVGTGTSLADKVADVQAYLAVPDVVSACSLMDDFKSQVAAQSGKKISAPLATQLLGDAETIEATIPCP
jgi:hypothetical protein